MIEILQNANYNGDLSEMNKIWEDELYKICFSFKNAAKNKDQKGIIKELEERTNDLNTIRNVMNGDDDESKLLELLENSQNRHKNQDPNYNNNNNETINNKNAINDNKKWDELLDNFVKNPPTQNGLNKLLNANKIYLSELNGRINDMNGVKIIKDKKINDAIGDEEVEDEQKNY